MALSKAEFLGYRHNSMSHLRKRLEARKGDQAGILSESLFSMDEDFPDVEGIKKIKREHGFLCIVDEVHAFGAPGEKRRGNARTVADVAVGTFGKALGLFGAFALQPAGYKEYLFNFSSPLIDSGLTETPGQMVAENIEAVERFSGVKVAGTIGRIERWSEPGEECYRPLATLFGER